MAVSEYYVDPNAGNDTTGNGTSGTPWKTVQKALNTITRNSTDGDRINVKAGTADTLSAALDYTTYGTPTGSAQLTIQGYTSSAGDGGIGEISGAATYSICTAWTYVTFADMKVGNCGSADVLDFGIGSSAYNCEIHTSSGFGVDCGNNASVVGCWFHGLTGSQAIDSPSTAAIIAYNFFDVAVTGSVIDGGNGVAIIGNIIDLSGGDTSVTGISAGSTSMTIVGNTIYCSQANTERGIYVTGAHCVVVNNVIEGWSGAGGDGIEATVFAMVGANAAYNCTAAYTLTAAKLNYAIAANDTLGGSPFANAGSDDFSIADSQAGVTEDAYPASFRGL